MRVKSTRNQNVEPQENPDGTPTPRSYLDQAEVCRQQAHEAARLQRLRAACGLFDTAIALCKCAVQLGGATAGEAAELLRSLRSEHAAYLELLRSLNRPLLKA